MLSIWCMVDCIVHLYAVTLIHHMYKLHLILKNTGTLITLSFNKTTSELLPSDKFLMIFIIYSHTLAKLNTNTHLSTNKELSSPQHNCLFICCCCCMPSTNKELSSPQLPFHLLLLLLLHAHLPTLYKWSSTLSQKNKPTIASCSFIQAWIDFDNLG